MNPLSEDRHALPFEPFETFASLNFNQPQLISTHWIIINIATTAGCHTLYRISQCGKKTLRFPKKNEHTTRIGGQFFWSLCHCFKSHSILRSFLFPAPNRIVVATNRCFFSFFGSRPRITPAKVTRLTPAFEPNPLTLFPWSNLNFKLAKSGSRHSRHYLHQDHNVTPLTQNPHTHSTTIIL